MRNRAKWVSRTILESHCYIVLCLSDEQLQSEKKRLNVKGDVEFPKERNGRVIELVRTDGKYCNIVCINLHGVSDTVEINGLIVHEAVHIYQNIMEYIKEDDPGIEIEAYVIQHIFKNLADTYNQMTKEE